MSARVRVVTAQLAAIAALLSWAPPAGAAAYPPIVGSNTRTMFAQFNFGPSIGIDPSITQFKISQEFGYHIMTPGKGPAIGASLAEAFGDSVFRFQIGPKFWWDFQPAPGLGLYLTPTFKLGYSLYSPDNGTNHYFNFQFGFEVKMVLGNRGFVMFRPFTLDMGGGGGDYDQGFVAHYELMFGGGVVF